MEKKVLLVECPDAKGLIAQITTICSKHQLNITRNTEFVDPTLGVFFMRTQLEGFFDDASLVKDLEQVLPLGTKCSLVAERKKKVVILVTKEAHCLGDILIKVFDGTLPLEIAAVVGNHPDLQTLTEKFALPYHWISHLDKSREAYEAQLSHVVDSYAPDYLVLAKFMRVLSPKFVAKYPTRIINIHHSFLPAFVGANPYQQAFERGVKIIGATAHFVTNALDEGPIIKQLVTPVDHTYSAQAMAKAGRDVEKNVLSKALQLVLEDRVFVAGNKTVIL